MRAEQLKVALDEIREIFAAAGLATATSDFARLAAYVEKQGDRDLDDVLSEIREKLDPTASKRVAVAQHVGRLTQAGLDEPKFRSALSQLRTDLTLDKQDVLQVLKDYGVIRISGKSRDDLLESLDKYFYWLLYNRDADAMAKRATPW